MIRMFLSRTYLLSSIHFWDSFEAIQQMQVFLNTPKLHSFSQRSQSNNRSPIMKCIISDRTGRGLERTDSANDPGWTPIAKKIWPMQQEATTALQSTQLCKANCFSR